MSLPDPELRLNDAARDYALINIFLLGRINLRILSTIYSKMSEVSAETVPTTIQKVARDELAKIYHELGDIGELNIEGFLDGLPL